MTIEQIANVTIPPAKWTEKIKYKSGRTGDIMKETFSCYRECNQDVAKLVPYLQGNTPFDTCFNIWNLISKNVRYKEDPEGWQWVREPKRLWWSKTGDCKSYAVFIASCLDHLGINFYFRFVNFPKDEKKGIHVPTHVYIAVPYGDTEIIIDPASGGLPFNVEVPYKKKWDYAMTQVGRLGAAPVSQIRQILASRKAPMIGRSSMPRRGRIGFATLGCSIGVGEAEAVEAKANQTKDMIQAAIPIFKGIVAKLFGGGGPNPEDWRGWDKLDDQWKLPRGTQAAAWTWKDGDSTQNEALNILQYIANVRGGDPSYLINYPVDGRIITPDMLYAKLVRGGYPTQAAQVRDLMNSVIAGKPVGTAIPLLQPVGSGGTGAGTYNPAPVVTDSDFTTPLLIGAAILGGGYLLMNNGKKKK